MRREKFLENYKEKIQEMTLPEILFEFPSPDHSIWTHTTSNLPRHPDVARIQKWASPEYTANAFKFKI